MNIITVTVNPAIDIHLRAEHLTVGRDNAAKIERRDNGGKGINVSRALSSYGTDNLCYFIAGRENSSGFSRELDERGMNYLYTLTDGYVRENINIHSEDFETVIATEGPGVSEQTVGFMSDALMPMLSAGDVLCFCGRISALSDKGAMIRFLKKARDKGVRLVLDSKSLSREELLELKAYLIKPNLEELEQLLDTEIEDLSEALPRLRELCRGGIENILVTLGADCGALVTENKTFIGEVPKIKVVSAVGAGDSTIAGFLSAKAEGLSDADTLRLALSFGCAACLTEGSMPPNTCEINSMKSRINVKEL